MKQNILYQESETVLAMWEILNKWKLPKLVQFDEYSKILQGLKYEMLGK